MKKEHCELLLNLLGDKRTIILRKVDKNKLYISSKKRKNTRDLPTRDMFSGVREINMKSDSYIADQMVKFRGICELICYEIAKIYLDYPPEYYDSSEKAPAVTISNAPGVLAVYLYHDVENESIDRIIDFYRNLSNAKENDLPDTNTNPDYSEEESANIQVEMTVENEKVMNESISMNQQNIEQSTHMGEERNAMKRYIGEIQRTPGPYNSAYYNFLPVFEIDNGCLIKIGEEERKELFPNYGNINLFASNRNRLSSIMTNRQLWTLEVGEYTLIDNSDRSKTYYQIDYDRWEKDFKPVTEVGYYPVIALKRGIDFTKPMVSVDAEFIAPCKYAVLRDEKYLYGPYEIKTINGQTNAVIPVEKDRIIEAYIPQNGSIESNCIVLNREDSEDNCHFIALNKDCTKILVDKMTENELMEVFSNNINKAAESGQFDSFSVTSQEYAESQSNPDKIEIWETRRKRIVTLLNNKQGWTNASESVVKFFIKMFAEYGDSEEFEPFVNAILNDPRSVSVMQSLRMARSRLQQLRQQEEEILQQLKQEEERLKKTKAENDLLAEKRASELMDSLQSEAKELKAKIARLKEEEKLGDEVREWRKKCDEYKAEADKQRNKYDTFRNEVNNIESQVDAKLKNAKSQAADIAFNGMIAEKMFSAASEWKKDEDTKKYQSISVSNVPSLQTEELIGYLCDSIKRYRPDYTNNDIINIFICMTQNFLTVFSGEPGTGKTSICNIIAHVMGLTGFQSYCENAQGINCNRYVPISVERGWTSKRDFIGYYNPLSQKFERSNSHLVDGLRILDAEAKRNESNYPFLILLDEANLSPMEYYWADFMNICDSDSPLNSISLGEDIQLQIPSTVRFTATINNDHTTEILSPRLIDRSSIIILPDVPYRPIADENLKQTDFVKMISWEQMTSVFDVQEGTILPMLKEIKAIYEDVQKIYSKMRVRISPRTDKAIQCYWATAQKLFESGDIDAGILALDYAVAQKLLPKINGSGENYGRYLEELLDVFKSNSLLMSANILKNIIQRGKDSMNYYQYF